MHGADVLDRCIVTYETEQFSAFSLCILQKHNCRNLDAKPPTIPSESLNVPSAVTDSMKLAAEHASNSGLPLPRAGFCYGLVCMLNVAS